MSAKMIRTDRHVWRSGVWTRLFGLLLAAIFLGCGGGGGGGNGNGNGGGGGGGNPVLLSGTAAAGAPIIGTVNVRGANGTLSLSPIRSDGTFSVDVSALAAPFVVWAEGSARGKTVALYATCDTPSDNVNVTPATDTAMAMALGDDPAGYYQADPDAPPPASAELDAAVQTLTTLLAEVFTALGLPADFDVMTSQFNADGSGFDHLLDMVAMTNDGQTASIVDEASQTVLFEQELVSGDVTTDVGPDQANTIVAGNLSREGQINMILRLIEELYAQTRPDAAALAAALDNYVSSDFMENGLTAPELYEDWAAPETENGPPVGVVLSNMTVYRAMTTQSYGNISIDEKGANADGVWVTFDVAASGISDAVITAFVQEVAGGPWKWAGGRCPFARGGDIEAQALKWIVGDSPAYYSGLDFEADDRGNLALDRGVARVAVFNPGLPAHTANGFIMNMVLLERPSPEVTEMEIVIPEPDGTFDNHLLSEEDGLNIAALTQEFVFVAANASEDPIYAWIDLLPENPVPLSELVPNEAAYFPVITTIGGQAADISMPAAAVSGDITATWQHPTAPGLAPRWTTLRLGNNIDQDRSESLDNPEAVPGDWTSATFTYPGQLSNPQWGYLAVAYAGSNSRTVYETAINFSIEP